MNDYLVFDLETQRSAQEVGGWHNIAEMKMSVGVLWDSRSSEFHIYYEDKVMDLIEHLQSGPRVIGFNHIGFDYTVLSGYYADNHERVEFLDKLKNLNNLDLLNDIKNRIGKRIKLDSIAQSTLGVGKSADGLMALKWYKEHLQGDSEKLKMIADYCTQDVEVTKNVYLYGINNGKILYEDKFVGIKGVEVEWDEAPDQETDSDSVQLSF